MYARREREGHRQDEGLAKTGIGQHPDFVSK